MGVHRGVVNNITQTIQSIQSAVIDAEADSSSKIKKVVVGIAGQHIRSLQHSDYITRSNSDQVIDENDLEKLVNQVYKLVMLPGEEIIHVLHHEYKVDGQSEIKELLECLVQDLKQISMLSLDKYHLLKILKMYKKCWNRF